VKLNGKVAVIIGGEGNVGKAVTAKFLAEGANVVIDWFSKDEWEGAKRLIPGSYDGEYIDICADSTKEDQVENLMKRSEEVFGSIDILIHTPGLLLMPPKKIWELDALSWNKIIEMNLTSAFLCTKHAIKIMLGKRKGSIIYFPSRGALEPKGGSTAYGIAKTGLVTLMLGLREELIDTDITVNCITPAIMVTPKTKMLPNADPSKWVTPEQIADFLCCICSDEGKILSGSILKLYAKI
jgi:NAD(P)-dependent dehydrogenase (short-subunit alcohol dehydrogenase family)